MFKLKPLIKTILTFAIPTITIWLCIKYSIALKTVLIAGAGMIIVTMLFLVYMFWYEFHELKGDFDD